MLGAVIPALDLSALLRFACTALAVIATAFVLIKKAASKYFVVDAGFGVSEEFHSRNHMPIGGGGCGCDAVGVGVTGCAVCTRSASKKCSRCKSIWYCSQECQTKHWIEEHNSKCRALEKFDTCRTGARRKSSAISLVPDQGSRKVLKKPKKILFPYDEFVKLFDWDKPDFPPCGLLNCGNSCFANVVLQCLASTRPLVAYLLEKDHNRGCSSRDDWCFLCELQIHIKRASESLQPFSPVNILSRLPNIGGNFGYGRQEDAHEFMRFAIDTMQSVCLNEYGGEKAVEPSTQETTIVQYIFGGHLQSQVICTNCDVVSKRYENMMDLTVEIHGDSESLEECLDQFTVKEWLDGENKYKCDGCNAYVKAWKRLTVHQAPNVLTVTLKRFQSGRFGKLNKRVTFPEHLDLSPYLSSASGDGSDRYTLYGVVVHLDMLNASFFGHYICYTKDSQGLWYRVDDCKVARVEVEEVLAQGAYMLLYHRNTPRKDPFVKPVELNLKTPMTQDSTRPASSSFSCSYSPCAVSMPAATKLRPNDSDFEMPCNIPSLRDTGHDRQPNENESANDVESEAEASRDESRMEAGDGSSADKDVIMEEAPSNADSPTPSADTANGTRSEQIWLTSPANGSGAKMKPIFARGFLDRGMPAGRKKGAPAGKPNGHLAFDYGNAEKCSPANGDCGGVPSFKRERRCSLPNGEPSLDVRSCTSGSNGVDCSRDLKHSNGF